MRKRATKSRLWILIKLKLPPRSSLQYHLRVSLVHQELRSLENHQLVIRPHSSMKCLLNVLMKYKDLKIFSWIIQAFVIRMSSGTIKMSNTMKVCHLRAPSISNKRCLLRHMDKRHNPWVSYRKATPLPRT